MAIRKITDNNSVKSLPSVESDLMSLQVSSDTKWVQVPMAALEGYREGLLIAAMAEDFGCPTDELPALVPYLLKTDKGAVLSYYGPRVGTSDDMPICVQVGDRYLEVTPENFSSLDFAVSSDLRSVAAFVYVERYKTAIPLGFYLSTPLQASDLRAFKSYDTVQQHLPSLTRREKPAYLKPVDYQNSVLKITSVSVTTIDGKEGSFQAVNGNVEFPDGSTGAMALKGKAKSFALSVLSDDGTYQLKDGALLTIGEGTEKTYKGTKYTAVPMFISIPNNELLQLCLF